MVVGDIATGTDVLVIGAGPGGYVAAIRAGQLDLDVTLVEKDAYGGTCLNHGCIPSKALITATGVAHEAGNAEGMGIHADPAIDMGGMMEWKEGVVSQLTGGVEKLCKANGVNLVEGRAEFDGENRARVAHGGDGQGSESIEFEHAIVATGSRPIEIPGFEFDGEHVLSSRDALSLESVPDSLVIVGAGYIGMELAGVFAKLGTDVTVVEMLEEALTGYADDLAKPVVDTMEDLGVEIRLGEAASGWEETGNGMSVTTETEDGEETSYACEKALVAVGRQPVTDTLNLEAIGLEPDEGGFLATDDRARTDLEHVFAVGDVAGEPMLAHKGMKEGQVAAEVIAGEPSALDYQAVPAAVFTEPEIGTVGMTETEAEEAGFEPAVGQMPFRASGRALTTGHTDGFVRVVADAESGFVLGGQIVGPEASELIAEVGLAIELGATLEDVAATIHTHPTLSEAVHEAAENALGHAIHTLNR
ncbi:dihydrolipoyl dehydrogenase [Halalkalicoccus sp. NIPERK01]|uniref:dihydrolipoyl dehydrogenase n=1 Tax=Halalkalicoccus sp. NIPERK01 TaxID=3053469 RepID=UPI00256F59A9|nr:dihydrolipoyl dehydrogenase [Halalkalicoccus sp. NIPERK01]MDL5363038.1 dihydrolipoyl dehydrogenase [Halalkalicoccus sp. NIPERK01]